jgi:hypothetical protein
MRRSKKSDRVLSGKEKLSRVVAMLTRLVERFDSEKIRV